MLTRRIALASVLAGGLNASSRPSTALIAQLKEIEAESGGKLGCAMLDTESGARTNYRSNQRFPLCSTFKFLACGLILERVDHGKERLERRVSFSKSDLVNYSPITSLHTGPEGMTVAELCHAALTVSDNTAGNLLLNSFGGPAALTAFAHSLGDRATRLDRMETELNDATPGDPRDTTTPGAMVNNLHKLLLGNSLSESSRTTLTNWMMQNTTGEARLRAGLPTSWKVGDKTGSGDHGTTNDIAILWPPHRKPILVAAYLTQSPGSADSRNAMFAKIGRALAI